MKIITCLALFALIAGTVSGQGLDAYSGKTFTAATPLAILSEGAAVTNTFDTGAAVGRSALVTQYKVDNTALANLQVTYSCGTNTTGVFAAVPAGTIAALAITNAAGVSVVSVVPVKLVNRYLRTIVTSSAAATNAVVGSVFIAE